MRDLNDITKATGLQEWVDATAELCGKIYDKYGAAEGARMISEAVNSTDAEDCCVAMLKSILDAEGGGEQ